MTAEYPEKELSSNIQRPPEQEKSNARIVIDALQEVEHTYSSATPSDRAALATAIQRYQDIVQFNDNELSSTEQAETQAEVNRVQELITRASSQLLQPLTPVVSSSPLTSPGRGKPSPPYMRRIRFALYMIIPVLLLTVVFSWIFSNISSAAPTTCVAGNLKIDGSTALEPLVSQTAKDYMQECPSAHITVPSPGSASFSGLASVEDKSIQIGDSDVFASSTQSDLVDHQVAVVIFALIVNKDVGLSNLNTDQIHNIYTGKYKNWNELGGHNFNIVPLSREPNSGTRDTFQKYILKGVQTILGTETPSDSSDSALQEVENTPGAISYTTLYGAALQASDITILSIDNHAPIPTLVQSNTYPFWNIEHMYTKGPPNALTRAFLDYVYKDVPNQTGKFKIGPYQGYLAPSSVTPKMKASRSPTS